LRGRVLKPDVAREVLVEDLLDLRVKLSLAMEAARPSLAVINAMQFKIRTLEAAIAKHRPTP
jgi:hypothetical protein